MLSVQQSRNAYKASSAPASERAVVAAHNFIVATRETGYRSIATAIAELVDNAIQAHATKIDIWVADQQSGSLGAEITIAVLDNGEGMDRDTLWAALQFGGTARFGDRSSLGRFGMGLPNSSVSQSRRFEVYSWRRSDVVLFSYLDVDEVAERTMEHVPAPIDRPIPAWAAGTAGTTGTLVVWPKCDRLDYRKASTIARKLHAPLGQMYRYLIWRGVTITINSEPVIAVDPLFCHPVTGEGGATRFGNPLEYEIEVQNSKPSTVRVRFTELPVTAWHHLSTEEKRARGVVGGAGVSFIRAGREIDFGWVLMGGKRKENYDDWWRCEVHFHPDLDEHFGVTHSKQGVNPTPFLQGVLGSDMEVIARTLNARVRSAFMSMKSSDVSLAARLATRQDQLLPPIFPKAARSNSEGLSYHVRSGDLLGREFYEIGKSSGKLTITINVNHPFYELVYKPAISERDGQSRFALECLLLAAARAELETPGSGKRSWLRKFRASWGDALAAFLDKA